MRAAAAATPTRADTPGNVSKYGSGPSEVCSIDTRSPFHASLDFTPASEPFRFRVTLEQDGREAVRREVRRD